MTNMKAAKPQVPDGARTLATEQPEYPYGLRIHLEEAQLSALGLGELPKLGSTFTITAKVEVCATSKDPSAESGQGRRLELQITDLDLNDDKEKSDAQVAGRIYTVPIQSNNGK